MPARRSAIIARVATAAPMESAVKGLPLGAITAAPDFTQRSASKMSAVNDGAVRTRAFSDIIIRCIKSITDHCAADERMVGDTKMAIADNHDRHFMAIGDAVDFILHRTSIGINKNGIRHDGY